MLRIGEVFIKSFASDDMIQEFEDYMQAKQLSMIIYSLSGLKNIISDTECKCMNLNYNFLMEQSNLLEEKMFPRNHNSDSIFSGFQDYKCNEKIAGILESAWKGENPDGKIKELQEELLQLHL